MQKEILLLLAKIDYAVADYKAALAKYESLGLETLSTGNNATNRRLKLIGEAYAVKGMGVNFICKVTWKGLCNGTEFLLPKNTHQLEYIRIEIDFTAKSASILLSSYLVFLFLPYILEFKSSSRISRSRILSQFLRIMIDSRIRRISVGLVTSENFVRQLTVT